ncbi:uncharacterized protein LJ206_006822 [Theristicus caerulescens]
MYTGTLATNVLKPATSSATLVVPKPEGMLPLKAPVLHREEQCTQVLSRLRFAGLSPRLSAQAKHSSQVVAELQVRGKPCLVESNRISVVDVKAAEHQGHLCTRTR